MVLGAAMTAVITRYRAPMDRLTGHLEHNVYDFEGLALTAYILSAFGFAVLAGLLLRRSIRPWWPRSCGYGIGFVPQATSRIPQRKAPPRPQRKTQINSFCMQHKWRLEAPAAVHIGGSARILSGLLHHSA